MHTHLWAGALYVLSWSDFVRLDPDGMSTRPSPGEAIWGTPLPPHRVRNVR